MSELSPEMLADIVQGLVVSTGGKTECGECHAPVREGNVVGVYARQSYADGRWRIHNTYCGECREETRRPPTDGVAECIAFGRLAVVADSTTQQSRLVLWKPMIRWSSDVHEGFDSGE